MFTLFALIKDATGAVDNDALIRDLKQKYPWANEYQITTETLAFPRVTEVVMKKPGWDVSFQIRPGEDMTLSVTELKKILGKKTTLPADFLSYNTELAIGFGDDPEKKYTDDIINIGEFVRENYPGVVIFDQYNQDVW